MKPNPRRVLIIDDSAIALASMSRLVRDAGYEVYTLDTPLGASREIIRQKIDLVLLDVNMPAMQGDRLAALFRKNTRLTDLALVLVSGEQATDLAELGQKVGADAVITKSEVPVGLIPLIARLLGRGAK